MFWTQSLAIMPSDTQEKILGEENTITVAEVFLAVKAPKAATCIKSDLTC